MYSAFSQWLGQWGGSSEDMELGEVWGGHCGPVLEWLVGNAIWPPNDYFHHCCQFSRPQSGWSSPQSSLSPVGMSGEWEVLIRGWAVCSPKRYRKSYTRWLWMWPPTLLGLLWVVTEVIKFQWGHESGSSFTVTDVLLQGGHVDPEACLVRKETDGWGWIMLPQVKERLGQQELGGARRVLVCRFQKEHGFANTPISDT